MTSKNDITGDSLVSKSSTASYRDNFDRIFGKREVEEEDEPTCPRCTGPMYTQAHWHYVQCDDCGYREQKKADEP